MKKMLTQAALVATLVALMTASAAWAGGGGGGAQPLIKRGQCSNGTDWKLKLKHEDAGLEVELEVDQNRNGRRWRVTLSRNGRTFFRGVRVTRAPSGSFSLERRTGAAGRIVATARALGSGETCRATATL